jgi:cytochrome c peroxidase
MRFKTRVETRFMSAAVIAAVLSTSAGIRSARAQSGPGPLGLAPLSTVRPPEPINLLTYVRDRSRAIALGKALFWDMQAGSDGKTACATCHFAAGADLRSRNQLNPRVGPFTVNGPNFQLSAADFPTHRLTDPNDRGSTVLFDTDNVTGSQGVIPSNFVAVVPGSPSENVIFDGPDDIFNVGGVNVRRATGRNTPSNINAVFNFRNFWDGRAQNDFNGVNPFGSRDPSAKVAKVNSFGQVVLVTVSLSNSSLASQAVGPPGNGVEMSAEGRTLRDIGHKLFTLQPLGLQRVSATDSVLAPYVSTSGMGLRVSYDGLIRAAFQPAWWNSSAILTDAVTGRSYTMMEYNFALFWGLAIQMYEATLVSGQTRFDQFLAGDANALSLQEQKGLGTFKGKGGCVNCHGGPELTSAATSTVNSSGKFSFFRIDSTSGVYSDTGFANIGVRPTASDPGNGGFDPFGTTLSFTRLAGATPEAVQGSFKVPPLRNVELTAPYFHNGGALTLRQVVEFYSRRGDFANAEQNPMIANLALDDSEKDDLVAFLKSLTDERVRIQSAPFDHPQLLVPVGQQTNPDGSIMTDANGVAVDCILDVPATGTAGGAPLPTFESFAFTGPPCSG